MSLANLEGNGGVYRVLQAVRLHLHLLRHAVDVDFHSSYLARPVVDDEDVLPVIGLEGRLRYCLECFFWPFVDDVGADFAVLAPEIPTAVAVAVIHPGKYRA